jgi:ribosomal protein L7/L12
MSDNIQEKAAPAEITTPIIVSLGKKKKKVIKRLKKGRGAAMDEVLDVVEQVQANLGDDAAGKVIVPVVVIYRQKMRCFRGIF